MRKTFIEMTRQELADNTQSHVLLGDISVGGFLKQGDELIDRVINMGITEQGMVGFAAGLSMVKKTGNIIVHTISAFLVERAFEQIKLCCGYNGARLILISANGPFDYEKLGPTHHSASEVNLLSTIPDLNIRLPSTTEDLREIYHEALHGDKSTYIRLTSRSAVVTVPSATIGDYKRIWLSGGIQSATDSGKETALVCTGESLAYVLSNWHTDATVFWTSNPFAPLPQEINSYSRVLIFEPYTQPVIRAPHGAIRKTFSKAHKKIINHDLGWEDFA